VGVNVVMAGFSRTVSTAFHFAADLKRIGFLAAFYALFVAAVAAVLLSSGKRVIESIAALNVLGAAGGILSLVAGAFVVAAVFFLANLVVTGALVHNAGALAGGRPCGLRQSIGAAWKKSASLLGVFAITVAITVAVGVVAAFFSAVFAFFPPAFLAWEATVLVAGITLHLALLFANYEVMLFGKGAVEAVAASARFFADNVAGTVTVFLISVVAMAACWAGYFVLLVFSTAALLASSVVGKGAAAGWALAVLGIAFAAALFCFSLLFQNGLYAAFLTTAQGTKGIKRSRSPKNKG